jgi:hypothetical protein
MRPAAENKAVKGAHVTVIATPRQCYMAVGGDDVVCGIHIKPASSGTVGRRPSVGYVGPDQSALTGRRVSSKIATYIPSRKIDRAKAGYLDMCEILAHAAALSKNLFGRRSDVGHLRIEAKVPVNARRKIQ